METKPVGMERIFITRLLVPRVGESGRSEESGCDSQLKKIIFAPEFQIKQPL